jgi:Protein of unknown function (DUF3105)
MSPDGLWVWDGARWLPTTSPDGLWRWDGYGWRPLPASLAVPAPAAGSSGSTTRVLVLAGCIVALVGIMAIAAIAVSGRRGVAQTQPSSSAAAGGALSYPGAPAGTQVFDVPSRGHTTQHVRYAQTPPVGGVHAPVWLNCGIYDQPVPAENAVHSLEHGVVWITYDPSRLDSTQVDILRGMVGAHYVGRERYIILSPYPGLPAPVVASAWGVQLRADRASDVRLSQFVDYFLQGPQTPEHSGRCTGGIGRPIDGGADSGPVTLAPPRGGLLPV